MKLMISLLFVFMLFTVTTHTSHSLEIEIKDGHVKMKTDSGEEINTQSMDKPNSHTSESKISIGEVQTDDGNSNTVIRRTHLENVVIIKDGEKTIYNSTIEQTPQGKKHD